MDPAPLRVRELLGPKIYWNDFNDIGVDLIVGNFGVRNSNLTISRLSQSQNKKKIQICRPGWDQIFSVYKIPASFLNFC